MDLAKTLRHNPTQSYLYVLPLPAIAQMGAIHIPNSAIKIIYEGHIIKVGPNVQCLGYGPGDVVIWNVHTETLLSIDGFPRFGCVPECEIIGHIPMAKLLVATVAKEQPDVRTVQWPTQLTTPRGTGFSTSK